MLQSRRLLGQKVSWQVFKCLSSTNKLEFCSRCSSARVLSQNRSSGCGHSYLPRRGFCEKPAAESRKITPVADIQSRVLYFDTLALATKLRSKGFSEEQATVMVEAFVDVLNTNIEHHTKTMVTKAQQEITVQQLMSHIGAVKKDMVILEKSEFSMLRSETEKQALKLKQMEQTIKDEVLKLKNHMALDLNLERSRSVEAHAINEKELQTLSKNLDTEIARVLTKIEYNKGEWIKYVGGSAIALLGLVFAGLRLMM